MSATGALRLLEETVYVSVVPSALRVARNEPVAWVATGPGVSFTPRSVAWKELRSSLSEVAALIAQSPTTQNTTGSSLLMLYLLIELKFWEPVLVGLTDRDRQLNWRYR